MDTNEKATDMNAKLGFLERFAYGLGDYSGNLIYSAISSFLLVYYVSVLKADPAAAASIMAISKLFDGVSDLIMGRIVDKTKSKWGKARPWLMRMGIPLAVCSVLMYSVPSSLAGKAQIAYMFLTYNMVSTIFYTAYSVPYSTMMGLMTTNQNERALLGNFRVLLATAGTMTVNTFVMKMCKFFGGGDQYSQKGWTLTFTILAIAFILLNFITFFCCKERVGQQTEEKKTVDVPVPKALKSLIVNKYWILMVIVLFCVYFMMSTFFGSAYYYAQYIMGKESSFGSISNALSMAQVLIMFATPMIMVKIGKRKLIFAGMVISGIGFILTTPAGSNITLVIGCNILKGAGFGCAGAAMYGMLQDAITYGTWMTGVEAYGMGNAASSFCMKVGSGIGTAVLGWILGMGGFNVDPTSASAKAAINVSCIWIPLIACVICVVCMLVFDLDKHYGQAVEELEQGKYKNS